ncbi:MAG: transposase [Rhodospirillaceae bacterium]|nr:transposase [Rhodospirillaceae bacterium]
MRILHVLDHSIPLQSGYTFRTLSLLIEQRRLGSETHHLTTPRHTEPYQDQETVDDWVFHRTPAPGGINMPVLRERAEMAATEARLNEIIPIIKPDILHAHSPVLNALPAIRDGRRHGIPVNYEVRALGRCRRQPRIYPGSPWENGYNERFNGTLRREVLNAEWFNTTKQAQIVIN